MIMHPPNPLAPGSSPSPLSRLTFSWATPLFKLGGALTESDFWHLVPADDTQALCDSLLREWEKERERGRGTTSSSPSPSSPPSPPPSLARAYLRAFGPQYAVISLWVALKACFVLAQTQFLGLLLSALADDDESSPSPQSHVYGYAAGLCATATLGGMLHHFFFFEAWRSGMRWKAAACGAIFRKSLSLRLDALASVSAGKVVNIASNDVERFQKLAQMGAYVFLGPVESVVIVWLLWREVGPASLAGVAFLVLLVAIQSAFARTFGRLRAATAAVTDLRVRTTSQAVTGIRLLKMCGWEPAVARAVAAVRAKEVALVREGAVLRGLNEGIFTASQILVGAVTFFTAYALGHPLSPRAVFTSLSLLSFLQVEMTKFFTMGLEAIAEVRVTLDRLQAFFELDDVAIVAPKAVVKGLGGDDGTAPSPAAALSAAIEVTDLSCAWATARVGGGKPSAGATAAGTADPLSSPAHPPLTLSHISLKVRRGAFAAVVGPVGSGKSSLLMALLGELGPAGAVETAAAPVLALAPVPAPVRVEGRVAYVAQSPWIITASVRENVTFGLTFDEERYARVLHACCLEEDIAGFESGDMTVVGERGVNLSGGQRARIGLARACYLDADVYLLDDPLSAVDARVGRQLFERCLTGLLGGKTRVLVTHQLHFIRDADAISVLHAGRVVMQGTFDELAATHARAVEVRAGGAAGADVTGKVSSSSAGAGAGAIPALSLAEVGDALADLFESSSPSSSSSSDVAIDATSPSDAAADGGVPGIAVPPTPTPSSSSSSSSGPPAATPSAKSTPSSSLIQAEAMAEGAVQKSVVLRYWGAAGGGVCTGVTLLLLLAAGAASYMLTGVYLARWAGAGSTSGTPEAELYASVYGGLVAGAFVLSIVRSVMYFLVAVRASQRLHDDAFAHVLRAPLLFFDSNPAGRILNRLAKDVGLMDDLLPFIGFDFLATLAFCVATVALVCAVTPWVLIAALPLAALFFRLRAYYMRTARVVKRLESVTRSPVLSLQAECLAGLPVLRAFNLSPVLVARFHAALDANQRAYFAFLATSRWLGVRLDAMCFVLLIAVAFASASLRGTLPPALVGLSLSYALAITNAFQWMVRQSSEFENALVSVERVLEYTELETEDVDIAGRDPAALVATAAAAQKGAVTAKAAAAAASASADREELSSVIVAVPGLALRSLPVPSDWPRTGAVRLSGVWMRYRRGLAPVLRGVTADIPAGARVGVVGRTGAGKSSLFLALLRLVEPERYPLPPGIAREGGREGEGETTPPMGSGEGSGEGVDTSSPQTHAPGDTGIALDSVDIARVHLTRLRRAVSVIPQDPVLYAGTWRSNLDPFEEHSDEACNAALGRAQLLSVVAAKGGLTAAVHEGGSNLSVGERQLLCLARAVLRRTRLLLMDEASANVDLDTDAAIQGAVRTAFGGATIITVAHRLATIMDYDLVLVMGAGRALQFGPPAALLAQGRGAFFDLVGETGAKTAALLTKMAQEADAARRQGGGGGAPASS
jgi:ATP-binding cassette subfamily C (CFTR/MRP) protein 4